MNERKPVVLFLCSQNSSRSQMAKAFLQKYGSLPAVASGAEPATQAEAEPDKVSGNLSYQSSTISRTAKRFEDSCNAISPVP